ncbi:unnamed protein product, partial [Ectocarpus sp. 12 AP-2014]
VSRAPGPPPRSRGPGQRVASVVAVEGGLRGDGGLDPRAGGGADGGPSLRQDQPHRPAEVLRLSTPQGRDSGGHRIRGHLALGGRAHGPFAGRK